MSYYPYITIGKDMEQLPNEQYGLIKQQFCIGTNIVAYPHEHIEDQNQAWFMSNDIENIKLALIYNCWASRFKPSKIVEGTTVYIGLSKSQQKKADVLLLKFVARSSPIYWPENPLVWNDPKKTESEKIAVTF